MPIGSMPRIESGFTCTDDEVPGKDSNFVSQM
jgi:hypothetical protein